MCEANENVNQYFVCGTNCKLVRIDKLCIYGGAVGVVCVYFCAVLYMFSFFDYLLLYSLGWDFSFFFLLWLKKIPKNPVNNILAPLAMLSKKTISSY